MIPIPHVFSGDFYVMFNCKGKKLVIKLRNAQPETKSKDYSRLGDILPYFKCKKVRYGRAANKEFQVFIFDDTETN